MLVTRAELEFDFQKARFDLSKAGDRKILGWVFNQFLYGEVTGIQCGHWLYRAPHLAAASFLAKQASEELSHVRKILRILSLLEEKPAPAHGSIKLLSTGMMGGTWGEHVALEMALGEGLVLSVFYAMAQTIDQPEIHRILESAIAEEERHVEFGERETAAWLTQYPSTRKLLLAQALIQLWAMGRLKGFVVKRIARSAPADHPVLSKLDTFYDHALRMFELRIERLGLCDRPLRELSLGERAVLLGFLPFRRIKARVACRNRLLTATYLGDPALGAEKSRFHPSEEVPQ